MRKLLVYLSGILLTFLTIFGEAVSASDNSNYADRLRNSGSALKGILDVTDDIPQDLLDRAVCIVVFPSVLKAARKSGGSYGRGAMSCRQGDDFKGPWGAPTMMVLEGGSFGFQIRQESPDLVLLVINECGVKDIVNRQVKLGTDASSAAGPVGRDSSAGSEVIQRAEILSYSRTRAIFAGASLEGSTIRPDDGVNRRVYGRRIPVRDIVLSGTVAVPAAAEELISTLEMQTPKHRAYVRMD